MKRVNFLILLFFLSAIAVIGKLFVLQILGSDKLALSAENQHFSALEIRAKRGEILTSDAFPLAANEKVYLIYATLPNLKTDRKEIARLLAPIFIEEDQKDKVNLNEFEASDSAKIEAPKEPEKTKEEKLQEKEQEILNVLNVEKVVWVPLKRKVSRETTEKIKSLKIEGLGFEEEEKRFYPESSSSASLLGIVGSDANGEDKGYFGLEGFYNGELKGRPGRLKEEIDALGRPILVGSRIDIPPEDGRSLVLTIERGAQFIVEEKLRNSVQKYGAKGGAVLIMDPKNGAILASSVFPEFDPARWQKFDKEKLRNPVTSASYEPGSTFKVITASSGLDAGAVNSETKCPCNTPLRIGGFEIKTWNNKYYPNSTLAEILQHSDNVGAAFVAEKLGKEKLLDYIENFGFGKATGVDLEGESVGILKDRESFQPIDLTTASFGQGHSVTMIQMVRAVSAIANGGELYQPQIVRKIVGKDRTVVLKPKKVRQVIKKETGSTMTEMMVSAVEKGEARYFVPKGYRIAGKTGTAQVPIEGRYDPKKTVASFIGFAPADDPKFVMLVKLDEPQSSPWGSETAAPLFFDIAKELFTYWGIAPNR